MRKYIQSMLLFLALLTQWSCDKVDFLPIKGTIDGFVTDNNGKALAGVEVAAAYEAPTASGAPSSQTKSITTDSEGYYRLSDLWDEVTVKVEHQGFEPVVHLLDLGHQDSPSVNMVLNGSPTIQAVAFDKTSLVISSTEPDSIMAKIEIQDTYNKNSGIYGGNLLLVNTEGATKAIIPATSTQEGVNTILLIARIVGDGLVPGIYSVLVESFDPDNNLHRIRADESIRIE